MKTAFVDHFVKPPILDNWSDQEYREEVRRRVDQKCEDARQERQRKGRSVLGRVSVLEQSPEARSASQPRSRTRNPRVACRTVTLRMAFLVWLRPH